MASWAIIRTVQSSMQSFQVSTSVLFGVTIQRYQSHDQKFSSRSQICNGSKPLKKNPKKDFWKYFFNIYVILVSGSNVLNYLLSLSMYLAGKCEEEEVQGWTLEYNQPYSEVPFCCCWGTIVYRALMERCPDRHELFPSLSLSLALFLPPLSLREISWRCKMGNDDICGCRPVHIFVGPLGK